MAFLKHARADITQPSWSMDYWGNFVDRARGRVRTASSSPNLITQASEILQDNFSPDKYLLTHATIVASVDTVDVPNVKIGNVSELGHKVNRRWANYRVTPQTDIYINNNCDAWDRPVLLKSYRTFIGAHNFVEHVQIEDQSRGRIIDAAARDIGDSVYIDILIATNRRHASLIRDIESGRMGTMSMGCFLAGTQVTMADGTRVAIEDVAPGDMVVTHKGRAREVLNKQIKHYRGGLRRIKTVGVSSTIQATANHGFETLRPPTTCACGCNESLPTTSTHTRQMTRRFKTGHDKRVFNPNNTYSLEEARLRREQMDDIQSFKFTKVRADELEVGDFLCFPRAAFEGTTEGWTQARARLVGYFLAEGSFLKRKGEPVEVQFDFSMTEKETFVQEVVELLQSEFPQANVPWVQDRPERNTCVVHMAGREISEWFRRHCGEYSHGKRLSAEAMSLPAELHREIVGAWLNGDGTFGDANETLSGTTVSYDLGCQMHLLLARCGLFARIECSQNGRSIEISEAVGSGWLPDSETGKRPALTLVMGLTAASGLSDVCAKVGRETQAEQQLRVLDDHIIFPITSIESDWYEGPVHNMEVEEDHTYVVEGVTVHNCSVTETICTKCGNVAVDETETCEHIKYGKGQYEYDSQGHKYRVAELCGHSDLDPTGGVTFIEASWVAVPAFQGAVMRNILEPGSINLDTRSQMQRVLSEPPAHWTTPEDQMPKAARLLEVSFANSPSSLEIAGKIADLRKASRVAQMPPPPMPGAEGAPPEAAPADPMKDLEDEVQKYLLDKIKKNLKDKMIVDEDEEDAPSDEELSTSTNENINHQASKRAALVSGTGTLLRIARSDVELLDGLARLNQSHGIKISRDLYRTALRVGSTDGHPSLDKYLQRCAEVLGHKPHTGEAKTLVRLGRILSMRKKTRF